MDRTAKDKSRKDPAKDKAQTGPGNPTPEKETTPRSKGRGQGREAGSCNTRAHSGPY